MLHIGIDDTDSTSGMCTTYLLTEIIRELDYPLLFGFPRLVRLNPNVPWKTRGNGALSISLCGERAERKIGEMGGRTVYSSASPGEEPDAEFTLEKIIRVVERYARVEDDNTNPGVVITQQRPAEELYWKAVRGIVSMEEAVSRLRAAGALWHTWKKGRGIIGAGAAVAWPGERHTFEAIAYREKERWGTPRAVNAHDASRLSRLFPQTFNNYDELNSHVCISPSSPCPVLMGIRSTNSEVLQAAMSSVRSEPRERWLIYITNQGTDDHISELREMPELYSSYVCEGTVRTFPRTVAGGHVFFTLACSKSNIECAAYEETKEFRKYVRQLHPGDRVRVWGGFKPSAHGPMLNLEKMEVIATVERRLKLHNPDCPECGARMHSAGRNAGYRCRQCHRRAMEAHYTTSPPLPPGIYCTAVCARRHLSRPPEIVLPVMQALTGTN